MRYNQYYNNDTMNLKQLAKDLERQGYICELSEDGEYMSVYYNKLVSNQATQKAFGRCKIKTIAQRMLGYLSLHSN